MLDRSELVMTEWMSMPTLEDDDFTGVNLFRISEHLLCGPIIRVSITIK